MWPTGAANEKIGESRRGARLIEAQAVHGTRGNGLRLSYLNT
jgi:hypothetical protein